MIPFDLFDELGDMVDNGDVIDGVNDGTDVPEVTDNVDALETETPEDTEAEPDQDVEAESGDISETDDSQNIHKSDSEDPDLVLNPFSHAKEQWKGHFGGGKGSCNICRDDGFSCKGGYDGEYKIGAKCKNCGHLYEQHQW